MEEQISNTIHSKKKIIFVFIVILSLFLIALIISTAVDIQNKIKQGKYIGQNLESRNTIVVSETGEVYVKPDLAVISFSVVNEAKTVSEAMAKNTEKMNKVIETVKNQGVEEKDLKTISFNIYPRYEYYEKTGKRVLVGYEVTQELQVKIRDLTKIGTIIETATSAGANEIGNLALTVDKEDEFKKEARAQAVEKAKAKALELASQLGIKLGKIINFSENYYIPYLGQTEYMAKEGVRGGAPAAPSIETGENKISVSVVITYEIY